MSKHSKVTKSNISWIAAGFSLLLWIPAVVAQGPSLDTLEPGKYIYNDPKTGKTRRYYVPHPGGTKLDPTLPEKLLPDELLPEVLKKTGAAERETPDSDSKQNSSKSKPDKQKSADKKGDKASSPENPLSAEDSSSAPVKKHNTS